LVFAHVSIKKPATAFGRDVSGAVRQFFFDYVYSNRYFDDYCLKIIFEIE